MSVKFVRYTYAEADKMARERVDKMDGSGVFSNAYYYTYVKAERDSILKYGRTVEIESAKN